MLLSNVSLLDIFTLLFKTSVENIFENNVIEFQTGSCMHISKIFPFLSDAKKKNLILRKRKLLGRMETYQRSLRLIVFWIYNLFRLIE